MKTLFLLIVSVAALFEGFGDILLKKWAISNNKNIFLVIGLIIYLIGTILWAISLKYEFLSKAISIVTILNMLVVVGFGVLYFKEELSLVNIIGILLAVLSIFLIEY